MTKLNEYLRAIFCGKRGETLLNTDELWTILYCLLNGHQSSLDGEETIIDVNSKTTDKVVT